MDIKISDKSALKLNLAYANLSLNLVCTVLPESEILNAFQTLFPPTRRVHRAHLISQSEPSASSAHGSLLTACFQTIKTEDYILNFVPNIIPVFISYQPSYENHKRTNTQPRSRFRFIRQYSANLNKI